MTSGRSRHHLPPWSWYPGHGAEKCPAEAGQVMQTSTEVEPSNKRDAVVEVPK
jgi:hypothetical protein